MICSKCKSELTRKNGIVHFRQRYLCKSCGYTFTVERKSIAFPAATKHQALEMYLEGMGFRAITRQLKISHVSAHRWIRAFGQQAAPLQSEQAIDVVEMDELHTYIGNKKTIVG